MHLTTPSGVASCRPREGLESLRQQRLAGPRSGPRGRGSAQRNWRFRAAMPGVRKPDWECSEVSRSAETAIGIAGQYLEQVSRPSSDCTVMRFQAMALDSRCAGASFNSHGGQISAESTVGEGSTFLLTLPRARAARRETRTKKTVCGVSGCPGRPAARRP